MSDNLFEMTDAEYQEWLQGQGLDCVDFSVPCEENLCHLVSKALRSTQKEERAQLYVEVASMCLALADKTLGAQTIVAQCLIRPKH